MVKAKTLKKEWYPILAPKIFQNTVLGETFVFEPQQMIGKSVTGNLMNLTNDSKRQNININFKITGVQNGNAVTDVIGYYMAQSSIKRMVRRNIVKIIMSFPCKTSDNKNLLMKPLMITRSATTGSVATKIRKNAKDFIERYVSSISYDNLVNDLVNYKLQITLKKILSKIYPLRVCEIKSMELVVEKRVEEDKPKVDKTAKLAKKAEDKKSEEKSASQGKKQEPKESKEVPKSEEKKEEPSTSASVISTTL